MVRNWGGEGVERNFLPDESLVMRFGNFYLTSQRLVHYNAISSTFEFVHLGKFHISLGKGKVAQVLLVAFLVYFAATAVAGIFTIHTDPGLTIMGLSGIFMAFYGFVVFRRFYKDTYIIKPDGNGKKWVIRTASSEKGLSFALEVVKANNNFRNSALNPQYSVSS